MADTKPPLVTELIWDEELRFSATSGSAALVIAGDVVFMLQKGRHTVTALRVSFSGDRAPEPPRRFTSVSLHFNISGAVPRNAVERALALSHEKYCSVWHSMRQGIPFTTTFDV